MKDYQKIKIIDCGEPLLPIPLENFIVENPSPYEKLGADYQGKSPYYLREEVINNLLKASAKLHQIKKDWKIKIFDAYRPVEIQQFMVDYTFKSLCEERNLNINQLSDIERENIYQKVYQFWAIPSHNPDTPPPHSTGGAIDITLVDEKGNMVDMGGEIDEVSERSNPNYYVDINTSEGETYHQRRELLNNIMTSVGFHRHPGEWWHFCYGDQMWAWLSNLDDSSALLTAKYGRIE